LVSADSTFVSFREENRNRAMELLAKLNNKKCLKNTERKQAQCVLAHYAKALKLEYAAVDYDEGNRCSNYVRFSNLDTVVKHACIPYEQK
jgi:hypothetical protein